MFHDYITRINREDLNFKISQPLFLDLSLKRGGLLIACIWLIIAFAQIIFVAVTWPLGYFSHYTLFRLIECGKQFINFLSISLQKIFINQFILVGSLIALVPWTIGIYKVGRITDFHFIECIKKIILDFE